MIISVPAAHLCGSRVAGAEAGKGNLASLHSTRPSEAHLGPCGCWEVSIMRQGLLTGIAWYGRARGNEPSSEALVWAVRRDWPNGSHEFVRARMTEEAACRQLARDRSYWRRGPVRPPSLSVVQIRAHEFRSHGQLRQGCYEPNCASAAAITGVAR